MVDHRWLRHLGLQILTTIMSCGTTKARVLLFQHCKRLFCVPGPRSICGEEQVHLFQCALIRFGVECPDCGVLVVSCVYLRRYSGSPIGMLIILTAPKMYIIFSLMALTMYGRTRVSVLARRQLYVWGNRLSCELCLWHSPVANAPANDSKAVSLGPYLQREDFCWV